MRSFLDRDNLVSRTWQEMMEDCERMSRVKMANGTFKKTKDINFGKKPTMSLVPPSFCIYVAKALEDGAIKRSPYNWREESVSASNLLDKIERHLQLLKDRHDLAEDSGLHEMAHLAADAAVYIDAMEQGTLVDDRPIAGKAGIVMKRYTKE